MIHDLVCLAKYCKKMDNNLYWLVLKVVGVSVVTDLIFQLEQAEMSLDHSYYSQMEARLKIFQKSS